MGSGVAVGAEVSPGGGGAVADGVDAEVAVGNGAVGSRVDRGVDVREDVEVAVEVADGVLEPTGVSVSLGVVVEVNVGVKLIVTC